MQRSTLLIIDGSINLALGLLLLIFPNSLVEILGIPNASSPFYPNVLGGVLFGIAIALFVESRSSKSSGVGLGLTGAVIINLCGGVVLGAWLLLGGLGLPVRGQLILWILVVVLVGISAVELATSLYNKRKPG
jgi:hypothetical protein